MIKTVGNMMLNRELYCDIRRIAPVLPHVLLQACSVKELLDIISVSNLVEYNPDTFPKNNITIFLCPPYEIFLSSVSASNEILSTKFIEASDWWLHIEGLGGSHLILRKAKWLEDYKRVNCLTERLDILKYVNLQKLLPKPSNNKNETCQLKTNDSPPCGNQNLPNNDDHVYETETFSDNSVNDSKNPEVYKFSNKNQERDIMKLQDKFPISDDDQHLVFEQNSNTSKVYLNEDKFNYDLLINQDKHNSNLSFNKEITNNDFFNKQEKQNYYLSNNYEKPENDLFYNQVRQNYYVPYSNEKYSHDIFINKDEANYHNFTNEIPNNDLFISKEYTNYNRLMNQGKSNNNWPFNKEFPYHSCPLSKEYLINKYQFNQEYANNNRQYNKEYLNNYRRFNKEYPNNRQFNNDTHYNNRQFNNDTHYNNRQFNNDTHYNNRQFNNDTHYNNRQFNKDYPNNKQFDKEYPNNRKFNKEFPNNRQINKDYTNNKQFNNNTSNNRQLNRDNPYKNKRQSNNETSSNEKHINDNPNDNRAINKNKPNNNSRTKKHISFKYKSFNREKHNNDILTWKNPNNTVSTDKEKSNNDSLNNKEKYKKFKPFNKGKPRYLWSSNSDKLTSSTDMKQGHSISSTGSKTSIINQREIDRESKKDQPSNDMNGQNSNIDPTTTIKLKGSKCIANIDSNECGKTYHKENINQLPCEIKDEKSNFNELIDINMEKDSSNKITYKKPPVNILKDIDRISSQLPAYILSIFNQRTNLVYPGDDPLPGVSDPLNRLLKACHHVTDWLKLYSHIVPQVKSDKEIDSHLIDIKNKKNLNKEQRDEIYKDIRSEENKVENSSDSKFSSNKQGQQESLKNKKSIQSKKKIIDQNIPQSTLLPRLDNHSETKKNDIDNKIIFEPHDIPSGHMNLSTAKNIWESTFDIIKEKSDIEIYIKTILAVTERYLLAVGRVYLLVNEDKNPVEYKSTQIDWKFMIDIFHIILSFPSEYIPVESITFGRLWEQQMEYIYFANIEKAAPLEQLFEIVIQSIKGLYRICSFHNDPNFQLYKENESMMLMTDKYIQKTLLTISDILKNDKLLLPIKGTNYYEKYKDILNHSHKFLNTKAAPFTISSAISITDVMSRKKRFTIEYKQSDKLSKEPTLSEKVNFDLDGKKIKSFTKAIAALKLLRTSTTSLQQALGTAILLAAQRSQAKNEYSVRVSVTLGKNVSKSKNSKEAQMTTTNSVPVTIKFKGDVKDFLFSLDNKNDLKNVLWDNTNVPLLTEQKAH